MITLIDEAAKVCGSHAALARKLGVSHSLMTLMRKGERGLTPQLAILLAEIANTDATKAMAEAVIEGEKDPGKRAKIRAILGKALVVGGAAMLLTSCSVPDNYASPSRASVVQFVVSKLQDLTFHSLRHFRNWMRLVEFLGLDKGIARWAGNRLRSKAQYQGLHPRYPVGFASP